MVVLLFGFSFILIEWLQSRPNTLLHSNQIHIQYNSLHCRCMGDRHFIKKNNNEKQIVKTINMTFMGGKIV